MDRRKLCSSRRCLQKQGSERSAVTYARFYLAVIFDCRDIAFDVCVADVEDLKLWFVPEIKELPLDLAVFEVEALERQVCQVDEATPHLGPEFPRGKK